MSARLEVWQEPRGGPWRWRYVDPAHGDGTEPLELVGNRDHASREAAVHAAVTAYPDTEVHAPPDEGQAVAPSPRRLRRGRVLWWALVATAALWPLLRQVWRAALRRRPAAPAAGRARR